MTGKALIFSAPSGAGKTTIVKHLLEKIPELEFSISATTRNPRPNEKHGKDYYFLSSIQFDEKIRSDDFLEWEEVYTGTKYGTLTNEVEKIWAKGHTVVFDLDVVGGVNLKKKLGENVLAIFVKVKDVQTLRDRLKLRSTEDEESLNKRVSKAAEEFKYEPYFDVALVNENLDETLIEAENIIKDYLAK